VKAYKNLRAGEAMTALKRHGDALTFCADCFRTGVRGVTIAGVRAVVARAFYTGELPRLRAFRQVMVTGIMNGPSAVAAVTLRNHLMTIPSSARSDIQQVRIYGKTQRALYAFLRGENLTRLYEAHTELFPLPEEQP
jgi:hypothetical protein